MIYVAAVAKEETKSVYDNKHSARRCKIFENPKHFDLLTLRCYAILSLVFDRIKY